jgi:hypothetical protein
MASTRYSVDFRKVRFAIALVMSGAAGIYLFGLVFLSRVLPAFVRFPDRAGLLVLMLSAGCLAVAGTALSLLVLPPPRAVRLSRGIAAMALRAGHIFLVLPAFAILLDAIPGVSLDMPVEVSFTIGFTLAVFWYTASYLCRRMLRGVATEAGLTHVA